MRYPSSSSPCFEVLDARVLFSVVQASHADQFVDSIGVVTHITGDRGAYNDTIYGDHAQIRSALLDLGVRHIRDDYNVFDGLKQQRLLELAGDGIRGTLLMRPDTAATLASNLSPFIEAVEGPNESDLFGLTYNGKNFPQSTREFQADLYDAIKNNPATAHLPVVAPSLVFNADTLGQVPADIGNMHSYTTGAPAGNLDSELVKASRVAGENKPVYATETGYNTFEFSELAAAKYTTRLYLDYFLRGVDRTFNYELADEWSPTNPVLNNNDRESFFGLLDVDGPGPNANTMPKPAYLALRNLIDLLEDPGAPFTTQPLDFDLSGTVRDVKHLLMQKRDGSYYLALWQNASSYDFASRSDITVPDRPVTVTLNQTVNTATLYRPNQGASVVKTWNQPTAITLNVPDEPIILRFTGVQPPTAQEVVVQTVAVSGYGDGTAIAFPSYEAANQIRTRWTESRIGDGNDAESYRGIYKFTLPEIPEGKQLIGATFASNYISKFGAPSDPVVAVAYTSSKPQVVPGDWDRDTEAIELGTFLDTNTPLGRVSLSNTDLNQAITEAYARGDSFVSIRLQLAGSSTTTGGPGADFYSVVSSENNNVSARPTLTLSFEDVPTDTLRGDITASADDAMLVSRRPFTAATEVNPQYVDVRIGDENNDQAYSAVFKFDIPDIPTGKTIQSAKVNYTFLNRFGNPIDAVHAYAFNSSSGGVSLGDWNDDTDLISLGNVLTPSSTPGAYAIDSVATTGAVIDAYNRGQSKFNVRFELDSQTVTTGNSGPDFYQIVTSDHPDSTRHPWLEITLGNEPIRTQVVGPAGDGMISAPGPFTTGANVSTQYADTRVGDENDSLAYRSIFKFQLPALGPGSVVTSAKLNFTYLSSFNQPTQSLEAVAFNSGVSSVVASDWNDNTDLIGLGTLLSPTSQPGLKTLSGVSLIQAVQDAWDRGQTHLDVRLQLGAGQFLTGAGGADFYSIATNEWSTVDARPWLEIEYA